MPLALTLAELAQAIGAPAPLAGGETTVTTVSTDTRTIEPGAVFLALKGENVDGHTYIPAAVEKGAVAVIATQAVASTVPVLVVADTTRAYGDIALRVRQSFPGPVIGVTGSVGKTTTKELLATVLGPQFTVHKSAANFNNEIGVPQTILAAPESATAWVIEMGMRGAGQIAELARIAQPAVGIITGIGLSHIELLGSRQGIANAKTELFAALPESGISIFPATDDFAQTLAARARGRVLTVGLETKADLVASELTRHENGWRFTVTSPWGTTSAFLPSPGRFNVQNALLALAAGGALGIDLAALAQALGQFVPPAMRLETLTATCGATVLADCYNAAPDSMIGALQTLAEIPLGPGGKRVAVLGEMRELGRFAPEAHQMIGRVVAKLGVDLLVLVGEMTTHISAAAIAAGFSRDKVIYFDQTRNAAEGMAFFAQAGDAILVKGSRALQLEQVVLALGAPLTKEGAH